MSLVPEMRVAALGVQGLGPAATQRRITQSEASARRGCGQRHMTRGNAGRVVVDSQAWTYPLACIREIPSAPGPAYTPNAGPKRTI